MAINLANKYSDKIAQHFAQTSFIKGMTSNEYDFVGVKSLKIYTLATVAMNDYNRNASANRYGEPSEIQDTFQELVMKRDRSFVGVIDKGNDAEQMGVKNAMRWLRIQMDEKVTPESDKYAFSQFIMNAGKVAAIEEALDKDNVVGYLAEAMAYLDDKGVPYVGRTIYINTSTYSMLRQAPEFIGVDKLGEKALSKGVVGEFMGAKVVRVPNAYLANGTYFLITYKESVMFPWKISDTKLHEDPPGINGAQIEGRFNYDAFVLGAKADGVYVGADAAYALNAPEITCSAPGTSDMVISCEDAQTILYTIDGSDPRYSPDALTYSGAVSTADWAGDVTVKAVGYKQGKQTSDVTEVTYTVG